TRCRWPPFRGKCRMAGLSECLYARSRGSESQPVLPRSTLPAAGIAPAFASRASASVVLPEPVWPTSATVRMDSVEYFAMTSSQAESAAAPQQGAGRQDYGDNPNSTLGGVAASKPPAEADETDDEAGEAIGHPVGYAPP